MELDHSLSNVLSEFARTLVTDFPIQGILDHLVGRIVDVLPIDAAGVTLVSEVSGPHYIAASDSSALRYEQLQSELGEGPCVAAYITGEAVAIADLRVDARFPRFAPRALDEGLAAVFTFPLRQAGQQLGALDLYRRSPGALDPTMMSAAQTLADVAAAYLINARARSELQEASDRARDISLHDPLTGLPNRSMFTERLDHAILRCGRSRRTPAVLYVDLDHFKEVNDTHGHHVGDALLCAVAGRLSALLRPGDTVARLAGDEFVVLCEDIDDEAQLASIAGRIGAAINAPFVLPDAAVHITASVGIAYADHHEDPSERVLRDADAAMYQAKRAGGERYAIAHRGVPGAAVPI